MNTSNACLSSPKKVRVDFFTITVQERFPNCQSAVIELLDTRLSFVTKNWRRDISLDALLSWSIFDTRCEFRAKDFSFLAQGEPSALAWFRQKLSDACVPKAPFYCENCSCALAFAPSALCYFCPHCRAIVQKARDGAHRDLCKHRGLHYNFCDTGFFELVAPGWGNDHVMAFRSAQRAAFDTIFSYMVWTLLAWSLLFFSKFVLFFFFVFLTLLGYNLCQFVMKKMLRPILKRPPWERFSKISSFAGYMEELTSQDLGEHPGFLANAALLAKRAGLHDRARELLEKACSLCPNHPVLAQL